MKLKKLVIISFLAMAGLALLASSQFSPWLDKLVLPESHAFEGLPVKDMVTMIDLGAKKCIPCKMMAPILEKMEKKYRGKAAIIFIDVWENRDQAGRFGIRAIPTQIFYDKEGQEVYRHVGFLSEEAIVTQLKKMGVSD